MKSYTDLEQSKKLAEILSINSADAFYDMAEPEKRQVPIIGNPDDYYDMEDWTLPCWSLAALLVVLPERLIKPYYVPCLQKEDGKYSVAYGDDILLCKANNPIDACVEMIVKLKENNLI